jgi:hypothetical protein
MKDVPVLGLFYAPINQSFLLILQLFSHLIENKKEIT